MIKAAYYKVELEFVQPILGSQSTRDIAVEYVSKKSGFEISEEELETLPDQLDRMTTVFHRMDGDLERPCVCDYQVKGFLKEAGRVLNGKAGRKGVRNLKAKVRDLVFVSPKFIPFEEPPDSEGIDFFVRSLRAQTPMGEQVCIARSESLPAGTKIHFGLMVIQGDITQDVLEDLLDYGFLRGIGQRRNDGNGRFVYKLREEAADEDE